MRVFERLNDRCFVERCASAERFEERAETYADALQAIADWSDAYPIDVFPEPDWKKARELLEAGGITLDSVSAHCMRHVVDGVGRIAKKALQDDSEDQV